MAQLDLTKVFVNLLATGQAVAAQSTERSIQADMNGEVRTYGGGRQRFIGVEGAHGQFTLTLLLLTLTQVQTLESWMGLPVLVRDRRGQSLTGVFTSVVRAEHKSATLYNATITVKLVTAADGV